MSQQPASDTAPATMNVNRLGEFIDGWWDLVEGIGDDAEAVRAALKQHFDQRQMPDVISEERMAYVSRIGPGSEETRSILLLRTAPGISTIVHVGARGSDLYVAWRTHLKSVVNRWLLIWALVIAAGLGFFTGGMPWLFAPDQPIFSPGGFAVSAVLFFVIELALIVGAGWLRHRNLWAYFFIEARMFDADDMIALSIGVHGSLLHALHTVGVDVEELRFKHVFRSGRRREQI